MAHSITIILTWYLLHYDDDDEFIHIYNSEFLDEFSAFGVSSSTYYVNYEHGTFRKLHNSLDTYLQCMAYEYYVWRKTTALRVCDLAHWRGRVCIWWQFWIWHSARALFCKATIWHVIHWNWSMQSGEKNAVNSCCFLYFCCLFSPISFKENSATNSPVSTCCVVYW